MAKKNQPPDFEESLAELETLVERMEEGDLSLEDSLKTYEQGIKLSRACKQALDRVEERIRMLTEADGQARLEPFESPGGD